MDEIQPTARVTNLRDEFIQWLDRYLSLPEHCRVSETLWFGMMQKCSNYLEALLATSLELLLPLAGDAGSAAAEKMVAGKPLDRFTLGQRIQLIEELDVLISSGLRERHPDAIAQSRLLGKSGISMLHKLSRMRNDFAHGRVQEEDRVRFTSDFLTVAGELCRSRLVAATVALETDTA